MRRAQFASGPQHALAVQSIPINSREDLDAALAALAQNPSRGANLGRRGPVLAFIGRRTHPFGVPIRAHPSPPASFLSHRSRLPKNHRSPPAGILAVAHSLGRLVLARNKRTVPWREHRSFLGTLPRSTQRSQIFCYLAAKRGGTGGWLGLSTTPASTISTLASG